MSELPLAAPHHPTAVLSLGRAALGHQCSGCPAAVSEGGAGPTFVGRAARSSVATGRAV